MECKKCYTIFIEQINSMNDKKERGMINMLKANITPYSLWLMVIQ